MERDGECRKACDCPRERQEKARSEEMPERDARRENAQKTHPRRSIPAVAPRHPQDDDVREPRFDAGNRKRDRRFSNGERDCRGAPAGDAVVFGRCGEERFVAVRRVCGHGKSPHLRIR